MTSRSSEFWGICCEGGKKYSQVVQQKFRITMAALDPTVVPTSPVVSLMVDRNGSEYILCSLKPSNILQVKLDLYFDKGEKVTFSLKGQGKIYLSGYHVFENNSSVVPPAIKKAVKKVQTEKAVSVSPSKANAKLAKISDDSSATNETKKKDFKKNKASPKKKLDLSNGADSEDEDAFDELEDSSEDEESEEENDGDTNRLKSYKRLWSSLTGSDEEEEYESDGVEAMDEDSSKKEGTESPNKKKLKKENAEAKLSPLSAQKKTPKKDALNSSIGRTPMPQKKTNKVTESNDASKAVTPKKVTFDDDDDDSSDSDNEINTSLTASPSKAEQSASPSSEGKKKKKKKKKSDVGVTTEDNAEKSAKGLSSSTYSQKMPGGLEYEDIRVGNGPIAKKGRLVHVYYTGMLANNKVFDSREIGNKPFSFRLGGGDVIKGWDMAVEGMKVGGKRRMKIPANLGYKNQRMGPIPANSTLFFTVELKAVS